MIIFFSFLSIWFDWFNNFNCFLLFVIVFFVFFVFFFLFFFNFFFNLNLGFGLLEFWMCFIPIFFLISQIIPSIFLLFFFNFSNTSSDLTIKVVGHQWYWSYEIGDNLGFFFDSFMLSDEFFVLGDYRLLEVDNRLILPVNFFVRFVLTSFDVIHSWTLPMFFLKMDVMSGLLNIMDFFFESVGVFYGQCSEICGANHSFMPVVIELTLMNFFKSFFIF
uniref:cytochrome-c oxidase n=3 Tax=Heterodera glycines TaxID=51029 RepID=F6KBI3_HETGL|nr:cytochrome oxidase subunit 2 [Heterodera glycines]